MSLNSCIDIIIQIDSIRSIEILSHGLFYLKVSLSLKNSNEVLHGYPYNIVVYSKKSSSIISPSSIDAFSYITQTFVMKFNDEIINLNELCIFRIENPVFLPFPELTLNYKIFHSPASILFDLDALREMSHSDSFIEISNTEYTVHNYSVGFSQFLPIYLNDSLALNVTTCIHSFLCGYSFHLEETANVFQYPKPMLKELKKSPEFKNAILKSFFNTNKISRNELFGIYSKSVIFLAEFYEKTRNVLITFWGSNENDFSHLNDLSKEINKFNRTFRGDLRHTHDSFIQIEVAEIIDQLARGIFLVTKNLSVLQTFFIKTLQNHSTEFIKKIIKTYEDEQINLLKNRQILTQITCQDFTEIPVLDLSFRIEIANEFRYIPEIEYKRLNVYPKDIINSKNPFIFVDIVSTESSITSQTSNWIHFVKKVKKNKHLVVLVHGLYGSAMDMRILKNQLLVFFPSANVLISSYNEGKTEGNIQKMGARLNKEIKKYIADSFFNTSIEKISFIGFSLGGLIIRSAIDQIIDDFPQVHFFISLSTPHLGFYSDTSNLVKAGLWIMKTLKKCTSISQISLADQKSPIDSYLAGLSKSESISNFKHVSFISSFQDKYSPVHSSRVELISSKSGCLQNELARNILKNLRCKDLIRIDANFVFGNTFDNAIGRAAHIEMIDNKLLLEQILFECRGFFLCNN